MDESVFVFEKTKCGDKVFNPPLAIIDDPDIVPRSERGKFGNRGRIIGRLLYSEEHELALTSLHRFASKFLKGSGTCSGALMRVDLDANMNVRDAHLIEGTEFEL